MGLSKKSNFLLDSAPQKSVSAMGAARVADDYRGCVAVRRRGRRRRR